MTLARPEIVPFRLTPNMLDGLGLGGYEGGFRRTCEAAMAVLRGHREMLLSVLEAFIHDPLVEWTRRAGGGAAAAAAADGAGAGAGGGHVPATAAGAETENQDGVRIVRRIVERLDGVYNAGVEHLPSRNGSNSSRFREVAAKGGAHRLALTSASGSGLAIPGQVDRLLKEATDDRNLALMYLGWMPCC
jgi:phosphatidylinositol kinase/protein kinase (PI-3  family)